MPEHIIENEFAVNTVTRDAFKRANEPLHGMHVYILEAMLWGLDNDAAAWADGKTKWQLEKKVGAMLLWEPAEVMKFLFYDDAAYCAEVMEDAADNLDGMSHMQIASDLLETLKLEM